jgi:hypothetical protein
MRPTPMRKTLTLAAVTAALLSLALLPAPAAASSEPVAIPAPRIDAAASDGLQTAVFAGGCFWGVQVVYQHTSGVVNAVSGYAGGAKETAQYTRTNDGDTGHAEAVEIKFDPKKISYGKLLQIFFSVVHDPTQLNRQGPTSARNIARRSSRRPTSRRRSPKPISPSSTRQRSFTERSRPRSKAESRFTSARIIIRTMRRGTRISPTSSSTTGRRSATWRNIFRPISAKSRCW